MCSQHSNEQLTPYETTAISKEWHADCTNAFMHIQNDSIQVLVVGVCDQTHDWSQIGWSQISDG